MLKLTEEGNLDCRGMKIDLGNGVLISSTPDGQVAIWENDGKGNIVNSSAWLPVRHPQGTFPVQRGHRFARLDQDTQFDCNIFKITSHDDTLGASAVQFLQADGSPMNPDALAYAQWPDQGYPNNWLAIDFVSWDPALVRSVNPFDGSSTRTVRIQAKPGEKVRDFMVRFRTQIHDELFEQYGIGTQQGIPGRDSDFAISFSASRLPQGRIYLKPKHDPSLPRLSTFIVNGEVIKGSFLNGTNIPQVKLIDGPFSLDFAPNIAVTREVRLPDGSLRPPVAGDNCGGIGWSYGDQIGIGNIIANYLPDRGQLLVAGRYQGVPVWKFYEFMPQPGGGGWMVG